MQQKVPTAGLRPSPSATPSGRITLLGIDERSSGHDPVLASIFVTMRGASGRSFGDLAQILKTDADVLMHLEAGRVRALPPWPETFRLITDYGQLIQIDIQPLLTRVREQTGEKSAPLRVAVQQAPHGLITPSATAGLQPRTSDALPNERAATTRDRTDPVDPIPAEASATPTAPSHLERMAEKLSGRRQLEAKDEKAGLLGFRRYRTVITGAVSMLLIAGLLWTAQSQSPAVFAAVDQLPPGLVKSVRQSIERLTQSVSPSRDGLQWIESSDPRSRKADKLPVLSQSDKKGG